MRIRVRLGDKGQLVIPKIVRESVGLKENSSALLEVKENYIEIRPLSTGDWVENAKEMARKYGGDVKKLRWAYGDKLYEEEFSS